MEGDRELNAVLAHSMLGSLAAVKGAVEMLMTHDLDRATQQGLLEMALKRLDYLAESLRDLALGLPDEVVSFLDSLRRDGG